MDSSKYYVFYDGDCGFCNHWVKWILKNDRKNQFLFSPLQSEFGQGFLKDRNLSTKELNTLYLWKPGSFYLTKSQAVFAVGRILGGMNAVFGHMNFFPRMLTDFVYDKVAENRDRIPSQKCLVPTEEERKKFIEKLS
ncbi:DCC1-like thiol-disulfide oxidoreductase family protein [Chryseobacterium suipulveris]|uniref:DCC1-like thiol-disulfide oxidoreductase family protein n=1 Tax=Chryseobacterium suipulveris TaxID=2929800 RepID=A0ABY4BSM9_9FLAO|nr:DCC1-like thiol-disulfide oxidoreductase family protein [Chryseobacterium suipulveris]UOE41789.1 DCC1-like thiol-disulfide oxidoreductase family protein [Chryseobacterium suipulveris]